MKMTRITKIGMAALAVGLLAWVVLTLFTSGDTRTEAAKLDNGRCPECGQELPQAVKEFGGECPFCKLNGKSVEVGRARAGTSIFRGPAIPTTLVVCFVLLVLVHAVFLVRQRAAANKEDEDYYLVNCRKCGRRLRYRERQVGQLAKCPMCRTVIMFPKLPESESRWPRRLLGKLLGR